MSFRMAFDDVVPLFPESFADTPVTGGFPVVVAEGDDGGWLWYGRGKSVCCIILFYMSNSNARLLSVRITYVTHTRFPTEKAHGFQVASICQALARLGHTVTLLIPTVGNAIRENPLAYY